MSLSLLDVQEPKEKDVYLESLYKGEFGRFKSGKLAGQLLLRVNEVAFLLLPQFELGSRESLPYNDPIRLLPRGTKIILEVK